MSETTKTTREKIIELMTRLDEPMGVSEISYDVGVSPTAVWHHMHRLLKDKKVRKVKKGKVYMYRIIKQVEPKIRGRPKGPSTRTYIHALLVDRALSLEEIVQYLDITKRAGQYHLRRMVADEQVRCINNGRLDLYFTVMKGESND